MSEEALLFFKGNSDIINAMNYGYFIIKGGFWGYVLKMDTIGSIYNGEIQESLELLLGTKIFQFMFRKFAYFVLSDNSTSENLKVTRFI